VKISLELRGGKDMENLDVTDGNPATNEVQVDLHMLRPLMLNRVGGEVHYADVVAIDHCGLVECAVELSQELSKPRQQERGKPRVPSPRILL
jgi:hypothetical protein